MAKSEQDSSYYVYLTERMGRGESKNIVIPTVVDLIVQHLESKPDIKVLDVGCFNGAMLNRIRLLTPEDIRSRVRYMGAEIDKDLISDGSGKYPNIDFKQIDLGGSVSHLGLHDIAIVSNVLHEVIPDQSEDCSEIEHAVGSAMQKIATLVKQGGNLVILDGLKPDSDSKQITINYKSRELCQLYQLFAEQYVAFKVQVEYLGENQIKTRIKDLAAFLTKARYLYEAYWPIESSQLYQFFTREQFYKVIDESGFSVERFEPQMFSQEHIDEMFVSVNPQIEHPAKNVLVVAKRM